MPAYRQFQELRIASLHRSIAGLPASRLRMHVCWGAHKGPHNTDVPLKDIVDLMLAVQVEAYAVEAANPRHAHLTSPLREFSQDSCGLSHGCA